MRIVVTSQALTPWYGGSAISEASLCSHLGKNCEVTVLCREGAVDYAFVQSFALKDVREYRPREVVEAWRRPDHWLSRCVADADIFHLNGHWKWENYFFARLCQSRGVPYVLHPRGMLLIGHRRVYLKRIFNLIMGNWIVSHASAVIALSQFETNQIQPYPTRKGAIVVIPNGISSGTVGHSVTPLTNVGTSKPFFLYLGRLEARKNLVFLVRVFSRYVEQGGAADLYLIGPVERDYDRAVAAEIEALDLRRRVRLMPPVYEPERSIYLKNAVAVIYPSNDEPFGRVPFEAIAAGGIPIIPDASGSAEYLRPFLPQCVYRHRDADSLLETMKSVEGKSGKDLDIGLELARSWVDRELDWCGITKTVLQLYQKLLGSSRKDGLRSA